MNAKAIIEVMLAILVSEDVVSLARARQITETLETNFSGMPLEELDTAFVASTLKELK